LAINYFEELGFLGLTGQILFPCLAGQDLLHLDFTIPIFQAGLAVTA